MHVGHYDLFKHLCMHLDMNMSDIDICNYNYGKHVCT